MHLVQCVYDLHQSLHCITLLSPVFSGSHGQSLRFVGSHISTLLHQLQPRQRQNEQCTPG